MDHGVMICLNCHLHIFKELIKTKKKSFSVKCKKILTNQIFNISTFHKL